MSLRMASFHHSGKMVFLMVFIPVPLIFSTALTTIAVFFFHLLVSFVFFPVHFTSSLYVLSLFTTDTDWDTYNQEMWQKVINWITGCKKFYTTHEHIQMYSKGKHPRIMACPRPRSIFICTRN